jgi:uncharacterized metal-binding protein
VLFIYVSFSGCSFTFFFGVFFRVFFLQCFFVLICCIVGVVVDLSRS